MIVVSDTSPLNYLVLIRCEHVLPELFGRVLVPPAVIAELQHPRSPPVVAGWAASPPAWLEVRSPVSPDRTLGLGLDASEAIALARERRADAILIDERKAARIAHELGLIVTGTLAVLLAASEKRLIRLSEALAALPPNFRVSEAVLRTLQERAAALDASGQERQPR